VSFTVVPMFQMAPPYPAWLPRRLPAALLSALFAALVASLIAAVPARSVPGPAGPRIAAIAVAVLSALGFASMTLWLQHQRRRPRVDASLAFSRGAMLCLAAASLCWLASVGLPGLADRPWMDECIGLLCLVGCFVPAISGMLYKIVPFIAWLKLPYRRGPSAAAPSIAMFIPEPAMAAQMRLHFASLAMLLASLALPQLTRAAGLAFAASCAWLGINLAGGLRAYARLKDRTRAAARAHGS
jgi:hypothetical protein